MPKAEKPGSIVEQITKDRKQKEIFNASTERAAQKLPAFILKVNRLIRHHVPKPEVEKLNFSGYFQRIGGIHDDDFRSEKEIKTILEAKIPTEKGDVVVTIKSSSYPSTTKHNGNVNYIIDVADMEEYLAIDSNEARLESKSRKSSMPKDPMNVVIGMKYHTWPEWKRKVSEKDLNRYSELLDTLTSNPNVKFEGSTPKLFEMIPPKKSKKISKELTTIFSHK